MTAAAPSSTLADLSGSGLRKAKDRLATTLICGSFALALVPLVWLLWTVLSTRFSAPWNRSRCAR